MKKQGKRKQPEPSDPVPKERVATIRTIRKVQTLIADSCAFMLKTLARTLAIEGNFTLVGTVTASRETVRDAFTMEPQSTELLPPAEAFVSLKYNPNTG
jgi:hypothetical protein